MSWTCPECGKVLKRKSSAEGHLKTHGITPPESEQDMSNSIEEFLSGGITLGGEIGRLRALRAHQPERDWDSVYHAYAKVSGVADSREERVELRKNVNASRMQGRW